METKGWKNAMMQDASWNETERSRDIKENERRTTIRTGRTAVPKERPTNMLCVLRVKVML